ncbi:hypothetical protein MASR2M18_13340 [Ignavibacteria bacterium]|nr:hypothetical protein [Bacteroidota bacterium]MCZ2132295.1 hypothetical protein [Bacteroidota bacterium]
MATLYLLGITAAVFFIVITLIVIGQEIPYGIVLSAALFAVIVYGGWRIFKATVMRL